jgi:succinate dehydrogenase/fumarate reductase flavoprotein subunit
VAGAIGLNVRTGELVVCQSKAVILSAGGQARFSLPNSGYLYGVFDYPGNTGDGYVMAYGAGAELTGMEYSNRSMLIKDANMPLLAVTVTRGGQVRDTFGNILMEGECHSLGRMNDAFDQGRGPLRIRVSHLPSEVIDEIEHILFTTERPSQERFLKGRGIDYHKNDIELWPTECQLCGGHGMSGIYVNEKAETGIPGLYAAGDSAAVPKQHLSGAFVFGIIAAETAVAFIRGEPENRLNTEQVAALEQKRNERFTAAGREIDVRELEYKVRRLIGDYVISPKNEYKLSRWLEWGERFQTEINNHVAVHNGHELWKLFEVEHIVACANYSAAASLVRKESRWGDNHRRTDFPHRDDANWSKHIVLKSGGIDKEIVVGFKPTMGLGKMEKPI